MPNRILWATLLGWLVLQLPSFALTRFGNTSELEGDVTCGRGTGGLYAYARTPKFRVYICSEDGDPSVPRYYRSFSQGKLGLSLDAEDYEPRQGRYLIFKNNGYQYILDSGNGQTRTVQLIVKDPKDRILTEEVAQVYLESDGSAATKSQLQDRSVNLGCRDGESEFVTAETANFRVFICGGDLPHTYVGVAKKGGSRIRLDLQAIDPKADRFTAVNGDIRYQLTRQQLRVTQGKRILVAEPILSWN